MLIIVKDWRNDLLEVGDLFYHKRTLLRVVSKTKPNVKTGKFHVKFKRLCKIDLKPHIKRHSGYDD